MAMKAFVDICQCKQKFKNFCKIDDLISIKQKLIRVETCNGPLCVGKQASEYSIC